MIHILVGCIVAVVIDHTAAAVADHKVAVMVMSIAMLDMAVIDSVVVLNVDWIAAIEVAGKLVDTVAEAMPRVEEEAEEGCKDCLWEELLGILNCTAVAKGKALEGRLHQDKAGQAA